MDVDKVIRKVWHKLETEIGPIPDEYREDIAELAGGEPVLDDAEYVECFVLEMGIILKAHKLFKQIEKGTVESNKESKLSKRGKRFERRAYIGYFILSRLYTTPELYYPLFNRRPITKRRIDWQRMQSEWNDAHPSDTMKSPDVFRTSFYRIMREDEVIQEIFRRVKAEMDKFMEKFKELSNTLKEKHAQLENRRLEVHARLEKYERNSKEAKMTALEELAIIEEQVALTNSWVQSMLHDWSGVPELIFDRLAAAEMNGVKPRQEIVDKISKKASVMKRLMEQVKEEAPKVALELEQTKSDIKLYKEANNERPHSQEG